LFIFGNVEKLNNMNKDSIYNSQTDERTETDILEKVTDLHSLVVHNDEFNTFDWVIQSLIEICKMNEQQAEQSSLIIHYKGRYAVKSGEFTNLKPMKDGLVDRGISATID